MHDEREHGADSLEGADRVWVNIHRKLENVNKYYR